MDDAETAPHNLAACDITLHIVWDTVNATRPEKWDWDRLLDLSAGEKVWIVRYDDLGSYDEILDEALGG